MARLREQLDRAEAVAADAERARAAVGVGRAEAAALSQALARTVSMCFVHKVACTLKPEAVVL